MEAKLFKMTYLTPQHPTPTQKVTWKERWMGIVLVPSLSHIDPTMENCEDLLAIWPTSPFQYVLKVVALSNLSHNCILP
jgi:hypothetical protein